MLCSCREQPCRRITYAENFYFVFINPQGVTIKIQCLCQLADILVLFPREVRWRFLPFCSVLLSLTYSENIYQFSHTFDRELLTSDSLRSGLTEERDPITALVKGKDWQAPSFVDLRAPMLGRKGERHPAPRTACSISRSFVFYGELPASH